jgi:hypothetical protein
MVALASSCATLVRAPSGVEPERFLPPGAAVYARLDKATLSAALSSMSSLPKSERKDFAGIVDRTDTMTAAFVRPSGASRAGMLAIVEGRYPAGAASIKLSADKAWKKNGKVWERRDGSMSLAFAESGKIFLGTLPLTGLIASAASPHPNPVPDRWAEAWASPIAVYVPNPMVLVRDRIPLGDGIIPMTAMMLTGKPAKLVELGDYEATLSFEFETERAAIVFSPLCRIFLYAAANALWPERSATVTDSASWKTSGTVVTASGIPLDAASIAAFAGLAGL